MSEVKIYSCEPDLMSPQVEGKKWLCDFVLAADYAALEKKLTDMAVQLANSESKCRELAAENAGLKNSLEWLYETVSSESVSVPDEKYSSVTNAAQVLSETPVTDDFLAEVRAQGVEMLLSSLPPYYTARADIERLAAKLRKGDKS